MYYMTRAAAEAALTKAQKDKAVTSTRIMFHRNLRLKPLDVEDWQGRPEDMESPTWFRWIWELVVERGADK